MSAGDVCTYCMRSGHRASHCPRRQGGFISMGLAIVLAAGAAGSLTAWKVTSWYYEARIASDAQEARERVNAANGKANQAGADYEAEKARRKVRTVVVIKEIERELRIAPEWSGTALPDGVRDNLATAAADIAAAQPDGGLPTVPGAGAGDERGSGPGLRAGPGLGQRLPGAAP